MSQQTKLRARDDYRRKIQQRQTVVFGSITAVLIALLLLGIVFWTGLVPFPFDRGFTQPPAESQQAPCPPTGATATDPAKITARVYNSSVQGGLAGDVGAQLTAAGVTVTEVANWSGERLEPSATIYAGPAGVLSGYTLRAYFPESIVIFDPTNDSAIVDVVLGNGWTEMTAEPSEADFEAALVAPESCQPVDGAS